MPLFLEVKSGPMAGEKFKIQPGLKIGRSSGDILLPDPKISSLHAEIELTKDGTLVLMDRGSSNGTWVDDQKVKTVAMLPGVVFRLGRTQLRVFEEAEQVAVPGKIETEKTQTKVKEAAKDRRLEWVRTLSDQIPQLIGEDVPRADAVEAFQQVVKLSVVAGPQTDEVFCLGYGPRKFGSAVLDIELKDPSSPFLAFEIISDNGRPQFVTKEFRLVQLNSREVTHGHLKNGDVISFGETRILVTFLDGAAT